MDTVRTNSAYGTEPYLFSSCREQRGQCWVKSEWVNQVITNPEWILDEYVKTESEKPNKYRLSLKKKKKSWKISINITQEHIGNLFAAYEPKNVLKVHFRIQCYSFVTPTK